MLQIGCPKAKLLKEKIDQLDFELIHFEVVRLSGLTLQVKHTAASDEAAKAAMKKYIKTIENDPLAVVVVLGDLIDNATQGSKGCVFSQREMPQKQIETIIELLYPIKEKIIFFCIGQ